MKKIRLLGLASICAGIAFFVLSAQVGAPSSPSVSSPLKNPASGSSAHQDPTNTNSAAETSAGASKTNKSFPAGESTHSPRFQRVGNEIVAASGERYPLRTYRALAMPNDPAANQPWVSTANLAGAWDTPRGGTSTLLAIIDTGFALQHEEFQNRWYANTQEQANGIDDDDNGLVDDTSGWDFANWDNSVQAQAQGRHGTYVAGVAAATGGNGAGIAGVDWGTKILPIQALGEDGTGYNSDVANGIIYAADQGADVISLSLGSETSDAVVRQAVQYAISQGSIVVAAAGNDGCNCITYPANYPEVLSVGASENNGQPASFSSYGANLDILAPGVNLYTTDWQAANPTNAYAAGISGTSLATPIISGLLTRLKSQQPTATPIQLVAALTENTSRTGIASSASRNDLYGYGLVQAAPSTGRITTPYSPAQIHNFNPLSFGRALPGGSPAEESEGDSVAYRCSARPGTTPLHVLSKQGQETFSVSQAEVQRAISQGYSSNLLGHVCVTQPQDSPAQIVPVINLHKSHWGVNEAY